MKIIRLCLLGILLLLAACAPDMNEDEVVKNDDKKTSKQETAIVTSNEFSDQYYRTILPFRPSASRGVIVNQMGNRVDIDEMEAGLRRLSKEYYDPDKYFYEAGQYLGEDMMYNWLEREYTKEQLQQVIKEQVETYKDNYPGASERAIESLKEELRHENSLALNPPIENPWNEYKNTVEQQKNSPKYLTHVLEQNYLRKNGDNSVELAGMSIGIAMKSVYTFQTEIGGPNYYHNIPRDVMLEKGKAIAQTVLERIRKMEGLNDIPIMIAIYREEDQGSPVPGNYVVKTAVEGGDMSIDEWEKVNQDYILFPSDEAEKKYYDDHKLIQNFSAKVEEFFPNYVGVIGEGFYIDGELQSLTLEIPIEFYGKGEIIGFTQYAYGLVKEMFPNYYDLEIKVMSTNKLESIIYREAGQNDPTVHIFH